MLASALACLTAPLDVIDLRVGDALETLSRFDAGCLRRLPGRVELDGWKELYLPVLRLLEPVLLPGALIVADDLNLLPDILASYCGSLLLAATSPHDTSLTATASGTTSAE
jgi:predicted O-methyltransferase YrrM